MQPADPEVEASAEEAPLEVEPSLHGLVFAGAFGFAVVELIVFASVVASRGDDPPSAWAGMLLATGAMGLSAGCVFGLSEWVARRTVLPLGTWLGLSAALAMPFLSAALLKLGTGKLASPLEQIPRWLDGRDSLGSATWWLAFSTGVVCLYAPMLIARHQAWSVLGQNLAMAALATLWGGCWVVFGEPCATGPAYAALVLPRVLCTPAAVVAGAWYVRRVGERLGHHPPPFRVEWRRGRRVPLLLLGWVCVAGLGTWLSSLEDPPRSLSVWCWSQLEGLVRGEEARLELAESLLEEPLPLSQRFGYSTGGTLGASPASELKIAFERERIDRTQLAIRILKGLAEAGSLEAAFRLSQFSEGELSGTVVRRLGRDGSMLPAFRPRKERSSTQFLNQALDGAHPQALWEVGSDRRSARLLVAGSLGRHEEFDLARAPRRARYRVQFESPYAPALTEAVLLLEREAVIGEDGQPELELRVRVTNSASPRAPQTGWVRINRRARITASELPGTVLGTHDPLPGFVLLFVIGDLPEADGIAFNRWGWTGLSQSPSGTIWTGDGRFSNWGNLSYPPGSELFPGPMPLWTLRRNAGRVQLATATDGVALRTRWTPISAAEAAAHVSLWRSQPTIRGPDWLDRGRDFGYVTGLWSTCAPIGRPDSTRWLLEHQLADGGWSETAASMCGESCAILTREGRDRGEVGPTALACVALEGQAANQSRIRRGLGFLRNRVQFDGTFREVDGRTVGREASAVATLLLISNYASDTRDLEWRTSAVRAWGHALDNLRSLPPYWAAQILAAGARARFHFDRHERASYVAWVKQEAKSGSGEAQAALTLLGANPRRRARAPELNDTCEPWRLILVERMGPEVASRKFRELVAPRAKEVRRCRSGRYGEPGEHVRRTAFSRLNIERVERWAALRWVETREDR